MKTAFNSLSLITAYCISSLINTVKSSTVSVINTFSCNTTNNTPKVTYHGNDTSIKLWSCSTQKGSFYIDQDGNPSNRTSSNTILDVFSWSVSFVKGNLTSIIKTITPSLHCIFESATGTYSHTLTCRDQSTQLSIAYGSTLIPRNGTIYIGNPNGTLVQCLNGFNGFVITCFQHTPINPEPGPAHNTDSFNLLWLIPIATGATAIVACAAVASNKSLRAKAISLFSKPFSGAQDIELPISHNASNIKHYDGKDAPLLHQQ